MQSEAEEHDARGVWLAEQGRHDEAVACFREAVRLEAGRAASRYNLGNALMAAGRTDEAVAAYRSAVAIDPGFALAQRNLGLALLEEGALDDAAQTLRRAVDLDPHDTDSVSSLAIALLRRGDVKDALAAIEDNLAREPQRTRDLSLKAVALQRLGDLTRARRLLDFDRLIDASHPAAPPGFTDLAAFNEALAAHVLAHPSLDRSLAPHATRGGRHSGDLLLDSAPAIAALEGLIQDAAQRYVQRAAAPDAHPFLATAPDDVVLTAWAVVLDRGGYQTPHVHPAGWLSGVYYVRVPGAAPERPHQGWIEFGRPDPLIAGDAEYATRRLRPEAGTLVLFPSYFYHHTLPFGTSGPRISIAFDLMPASCKAGARHRLPAG